MLEKLTPEQEALVPIHRDEYIDFIVNNYKYCPDKLRVEDVKDDIEWIYRKAGLEPPSKIYIAYSYHQEKQMIEDILGEKPKKLIEHGMGLPWSTWVSFYSYFTRIGVINNEDFNRYYSFLRKGIWSIQYFTDWCILTQMPLKVNRDEQKRMHSLDGPAIEWRV